MKPLRNAFGWFAARTCSLEYCAENVFPRYVDDLDFWEGYTRGAYLKSIGI